MELATRQYLTWHRGDIVSYQNYVLSRMPEVWGETLPCSTHRDGSRIMESVSHIVLLVSHIWPCLQDEEKLIHLCPEYHSWNAGPRSCLGRALATYEDIAISAAILQRFDVLLSNTEREYEPLAALNMVIQLSHIIYINHEY
jgi:cytochrome P450